MWISKHHRLLIYNDLQFKEEASVQLTMTNVLLFGVSCVVFLGGLIFLLVRVFSTANPSTSAALQAEARNQLIGIYAQLDSLEKAVAAKEVYIQQIKKIINKDFDTEKKISEATKPAASGNEPKPANQNVVPAKTDLVVAMQENAKNPTALPTLPTPSTPTASLSNGIGSQNVGYVAPLRGVLKDSFSIERRHYGVDIVAPKGSIIKSVQEGIVFLSSWSLEQGYCLGVLHTDGSIAFYKNNSSLLKKEGDRVKPNEAIAVIGEQGQGANPVHLHFELWKQGLPVRPQAFIQF